MKPSGLYRGPFYVASCAQCHKALLIGGAQNLTTCAAGGPLRVRCAGCRDVAVYSPAEVRGTLTKAERKALAL